MVAALPALTAEEGARVAAATAAAEAHTAGEIVTVAAGRSARYRDVHARWALAGALLVPAVAAAFPVGLTRLADLLAGGWEGASSRHLLIATLLLQALVAAGVMLATLWPPLGLAVVPGPVRRRRVRAHAAELFAVTVGGRTAGRTGVLLYLSRAERMAELVADEAVHAHVPEARWGEAMAALVAHARAGRTADGLVAAVGLVGAVLAEVLPPDAHDRNELSDAPITL